MSTEFGSPIEINMKRLLINLLLVLCGSALANGQSLQVWPGDVTNNGVVNNIDFLHLGLAYNYIGPQRDSVNVNWLPVQASPWSGQFANGTNYAYADCNGDGIVNYYYDAFPIYVHYGKTHGPVTPDVYQTGVQGLDPSLHFDDNAAPSQLVGGQQFTLPLVLGSPDLPMEDFYGIAFSIFVDEEFIDVDQVDLELGGYSWANPDNDRIFGVNRVSSKRIDVGWVRTDHNEKSGYGPIGDADFIVIDDVVGVQESFMLRIDSIRVLDRFGNETTVAGDTLWLTVVPDATASVERPERKVGQPLVAPNPASDAFSIESPEPVRQISLSDAAGRIILQARPDDRRYSCRLPELKAGLYFLQIQTDTGLYFQKLSIE